MKICTVCGEMNDNNTIVCKYCENEDLRTIISMNINNLNNSFNGKFEEKDD